MDELFKLCKEVYKRTAWYGTALLITEDGPTMIGPMDKDSSVPLYTSDYLLEKLPASIFEPKGFVPTHPIVRLMVVKQEGQYVADYWFYDKYDMSPWFGTNTSTADTPLKALLKLTIALDDAGVKL